MTFAPERRWEGMALTPLHSLRFVVGECNVVGRRSFRGTWEPTPPDPTGLDVGAVRRTIGRRRHTPLPPTVAGPCPQQVAPEGGYTGALLANQEGEHDA